MRMSEMNPVAAGRAFMSRALQLSLYGGPRVSPNPFVGSVITAGGRIIGEGFHRRFGNAHAEVNAVDSVGAADRGLLKESVMYVTLEPCSHFGKTPPCADLIIRTGIPRVVVAVEDPFLKTFESGIDKMRKAGIEVDTGLMRDEAVWINRRFFTAHTLRRPFVLLKWAQSADGFIAAADGRPVRLSNTFTQVLMHRWRAYYDAILVGTNTVITDNPRLDCRLWPAREAGRPERVTFDSPRLTGRSSLERGPLIRKAPDEGLPEFLHSLYADHKITSLMVEGGRETLESFLAEGLLDEVRIEVSQTRLGDGVPAPDPLPAIRRAALVEMTTEVFSGNSIRTFVKLPSDILPVC